MKPCPFCGKDKPRAFTLKTSANRFLGTVQCRSCQAKIERYCAHNQPRETALAAAKVAWEERNPKNV